MQADNVKGLGHQRWDMRAITGCDIKQGEHLVSQIN